MYIANRGHVKRIKRTTQSQFIITKFLMKARGHNVNCTRLY